MFYLDRSRLETAQRCPRRYYWEYVYKGLGLSPSKRALPLAFGGSAHLGLEQILRGLGVEKGVEVALKEFEAQARGRGIELQPNEDAFSVYTEQRALLEALLRAWFIVRYPQFCEEYEVLDIEKEELWKLSSNISFMARADGVLRSKNDGDLYVLSFKTAKQYNKKTGDMGRSDVQGISELVAVEERLGERVQGIQMEYLIKGRRDEWPKHSGIYQTSSPLVRPWISRDGRLAHSWDWTDLDGRHTLGSSYRKVLISDQMSIASWIDLLASKAIQPEAGACLDSWIVSPLPYNRNRDEVESWKRQTAGQARDLKLRGGVVEEARIADYGNFHAALDNNFIQHRHSCEYPTHCPFYAICFGSAGATPEASGQYVVRDPNHPLELESD